MKLYFYFYVSAFSTVCVFDSEKRWDDAIVTGATVNTTKCKSPLSDLKFCFIFDQNYRKKKQTKHPPTHADILLKHKTTQHLEKSDVAQGTQYIEKAYLNINLTKYRQLLTDSANWFLLYMFKLKAKRDRYFCYKSFGIRIIYREVCQG